MSECENAGTYANTRKAWGEFQTHIDTNIVEVTDNFISNNVDVKLSHKNVNGEMVFIAEGPSSVDNVSRMFCLGQPTEDHGGVHNEKGHGLKVFQAYTGTDSLTFVRKETDLSRKMSERLARVNAEHTKEYEHWILRYGPRHDELGKGEGEPAIIKTTKAKIDLDKGEILDCPVQQRLVVENLLSRDHPFADKDKSYSHNIRSLVNVFESFPKDGEYLMFMYYGFNKQWNYMQNRPVPKFAPLANGDMLLNGTSKCSDIMASMYAHSLMVSSIHVGDKKIVSHNPQDYNMNQALWRTYSTEHIGSFKMKAAFHREFLDRDSKFTLKHGKLDTSGTWLYYDTRMVNKKSSFFETLYDDVMGTKFGDRYVSFTKLMSSLTGGGKQTDYVKNEMQKYANHLGVNLSALPFTHDEFDRIYENFGKFVNVKRGGTFCLLGFATRFEISSEFFVFDVSKEKISYHLRNQCDLWKLLQKIRWEQIKWCFVNICKINAAALNQIAPKIQSSSASSSTSAIHEIDDSSDEEEVTCDEITPTASGRARKKTALMNVASFTDTNFRKKGKARITSKSLLIDLKTIMKKHPNMNARLKKDLMELIKKKSTD